MFHHASLTSQDLGKLSAEGCCTDTIRVIVGGFYRCFYRRFILLGMKVPYCTVSLKHPYLFTSYNSTPSKRTQWTHPGYIVFPRIFSFRSSSLSLSTLLSSSLLSLSLSLSHYLFINFYFTINSNFRLTLLPLSPVLSSSHPPAIFCLLCSFT